MKAIHYPNMIRSHLVTMAPMAPFSIALIIEFVETDNPEVKENITF